MIDITKKILTSMLFKIFSSVMVIIGYINDFHEFCNIWGGKFLDILKYTFIILLIVSLTITYIQNKRKDKELKILDNLKKENEILKGENELLLETAYNGIKYTENKVKITFDLENQKYHFCFEKHYIITSNIIPEYYSAQFYANKFITDKDKSQTFYRSNKILWKDLNVKACISYKRPDETRFSDGINLSIININDNTNYIPFKIKYNKLDNGKKIKLTRGTEVKLKYCYSVPIRYWGSYINRSVSYFEEKTIVELNYKNKCTLNVDIQKLLADGNPIELEQSKYEINHSMESNDNKKIKIVLKSEKCCRYRITWDSKEYFGGDEETTVDGKDELGLTNR
jgi:hypothetical protein